MANSTRFASFRKRMGARAVPMMVAGSVFALGAPLLAQDSSDGAQGDYLEALRSCQAIADNSERLACYDGAVGSIVTASDAGDVQFVDRDDVRETRRSLFGFSIPDLGIFGGDDDEEEDELFETTIVSARYFGRNSVRFTTAEGAVWEMNNIPRRLRTIREGNTVIFRPASFGYYFVRIQGQRGVKGRRVR